MKACPFCGAGETLLHINKGVWQGVHGYGPPVSHEIRHWCEKREGQPSPRLLRFVGKTEEDAISAWEKRV